MSFSCRPNKIWESLQPRSGVFLCVRRARTILSLVKFPSGPTFSIKRRFVAFTASSAIPLEDGRYADDIRCRTPHLSRKVSVALAVNSGPPSLDISTGRPNVANMVLKAEHRPAEPASLVPDLIRLCSVHPVKRSAATKLVLQPRNWK